MARPAVITDEIGKEITRIKQRHPTYSIRDIAKLLEPTLKDRVPGKTAISQYLKEVLQPAEKAINESGIDELWCLGAALSKEYSLPPDTIPYILNVQRIAANPVTIRRARWIAHLCHVVKNPEKLRDISFGYAYAELISNLAQQKLDTTEYDAFLRAGKYTELESLLWGKMNVDDKNLMLLTAGEAQPIKAVRFEGKKAFGICQTEVYLGSKFIWAGMLFKKGEIDHPPKNGEVVNLKTSFLLSKKQIKNNKDGGDNGKR